MADHWVQTYTGRKFSLSNPRAEDVAIEDIAHALSLQCRYNGHVREFYSVAQHCALVARAILDNNPFPGSDAARRMAFAGLLHDAAEAYIGDLVTPLKRELRSTEALRSDFPWTQNSSFTGKWVSAFDQIEGAVEAAIVERFGLEAIYPWPAEVTHYDLVLCATEKRDLLGQEPAPWGLPDECKPLEKVIYPWIPQAAEDVYLRTFGLLGGLR